MLEFLKNYWGALVIVAIGITFAIFIIKEEENNKP